MTTHLLTVDLLRTGALLIKITGDITDATLPTLQEDVRQGSLTIRTESERALRPLPVMVDVSKLNRAYSPEAITLLAEFEKTNRPYVERTAVLALILRSSLPVR